MARIYTNGVEEGNLDRTIGSSRFYLESSGVRSGTYCYRAQGASNTFYGYSYLPFSPAISEGYIRFAYKKTGFTATYVFDMFRWTKSTTVLGGLRINNTNNCLDIFTSTGTLVSSGTISMQPGIWNLIELYIKIADSNGIIVCKINGQTSGSFVGDTKPGADTTFDRVFIQEDRTGQSAYFDDFSINSTDGSADNTWCGDGKIIMLKPNGLGDVTQLTPSSGSVNWSLVDEVPPNTTDYVSGSVIDTYDLYSLTDSGINPALYNVNRVIPVAYARDSSATAQKAKYGLKTNSQEYWGEDIILGSTFALSYENQSGSILNPQTGNPWTVSELDALQVGIKIRGA